MKVSGWLLEARDLTCCQKSLRGEPPPAPLGGRGMLLRSQNHSFIGMNGLGPIKVEIEHAGFSKK